MHSAKNAVLSDTQHSQTDRSFSPISFVYMYLLAGIGLMVGVVSLL